MAAQLKLQKFLHSQSQSQQPQKPFNNPTSILMWNPNQDSSSAAAVVVQEDHEDSWEVKAFEEDTSNILGATWPPRSYSCTFCGREFRSAQALGGHMNVHRRDRAKLHQTPPPPPPVVVVGSGSNGGSSFVIPHQEFVTNGGHSHGHGLCFLYSLPNPNENGVFASTTTMNSCVNTEMAETYSLISPCPPLMNLKLKPRTINLPSSVSHFTTNTDKHYSGAISNDSKEELSAAIEEIDLELRLGHRSSSTP